MRLGTCAHTDLPTGNLSLKVRQGFSYSVDMPQGLLVATFVATTCHLNGRSARSNGDSASITKSENADT